MLSPDEIARLEWLADMQRQVDENKAAWRKFWYWLAVFACIALIAAVCVL